MISMLSSKRYENKPGAIIQKLSLTDRQILNDLSSEDIKEDSLRQEYWKENAYSTEYENKIKYKQDLMDFDKKIIKNEKYR